MNPARLVAIAAALLAAGCAPPLDTPPQLSAAPGEKLNVIDASSLNDLMLTVSDPADSVEYFQRALSEDPARAEFRRGYALSLARARRYAEAAAEFDRMGADGLMDDRLRVEHAHALARLSRWQEAEAQMALVSGGEDTARRHLIDAMLADQRADWAGADAAYDRARGRAANPAPILNNWGVSRMSRGEREAAARTFEEALSFDPTLFNAKNNLAVARALDGQYRVPLVTLSEEERAILLHNIAVIALRRGDASSAKGLLRMAIEAHPRHYPEAAGKLAALEATVTN